MEVRNTVFSFNFMAEIEDQIFEWAAHLSPRDALAFSVVCKRVQPRVEAIMYETIVFISFHERFQLSNMTHAERFEAVLHSRPAEFFAAHVRNVCITKTVPKELATLILTKCTGIQNLALWQSRDPEKLDIVKLITPLSPTLCSLSAGRYTLRRLADSGCVFPRLKYLAVGILPVEMQLPTLEWLPALSTVRLRVLQQPVVDDQWFQDMKTIVSTTQPLQELLLDVSNYCLEEVTSQVLRFGDDRIVVRDEEIQLDPVEEWKESFMA